MTGHVGGGEGEGLVLLYATIHHHVQIMPYLADRTRKEDRRCKRELAAKSGFLLKDLV